MTAGTSLVVGRENADNSVDVWIGSQGIHFPPDGGKPTSLTGGPPEGLGKPPADVKVDLANEDPQVRRGDWIVVVTIGRVQVARAEPDPSPVKRYFLRMP